MYPHVPDFLNQAGWKYDVNEHGEKGWIYPKGDGTFGWTKGVLPQKKFYRACSRVEERFEEVAKQEFKEIFLRGKY